MSLKADNQEGRCCVQSLLRLMRPPALHRDPPCVENSTLACENICDSSVFRCDSLCSAKKYEKCLIYYTENDHSIHLPNGLKVNIIVVISEIPCALIKQRLPSEDTCLLLNSTSDGKSDN